MKNDHNAPKKVYTTPKLIEVDGKIETGPVSFTQEVLVYYSPSS